MNNKLLFIWVVAPTGTSLDTIRDRQCGGIASVLWLVSWIAVIPAFLHESLCSCSFWREQLACSETNLFVSCCSCPKWPKGCSGVWIMCNFNHIRDETLFYRNNTYSQTRNYFTATFLYSRNRKLRDLAKYHQNRKISHILPNHQACGIWNLAL